MNVNTKLFSSLAVSAALLPSFLAPASAFSQAAAIFQNGNVYTGNDRQPRAQAVAVKDGRILFVGSDAAAVALARTRNPAR